MIFNLLLFLFCPFVSFVYVVRHISYTRMNTLIFISAFMSLCAILSPPFADLARHASDYAQFQIENSSNLIHTNGQDFVLYTLSYIFAKAGVNFDLIRGIFVFICYHISFILFQNLMENRKDLADSKFIFYAIFLCFFFSVPFLWIVNGLRSATADYLMVYACFSALQKKIFRTFIFAFFAVGTHFFTMIFVPVLFLPFFSIKIRPFIFKFIIVVSLFIGHLFFGSILGSSGSNNMALSENASNLYLQELNYSALSLGGLIAFILERLPLILITLKVLFSSKEWIDNREYMCFYSCIFLTSICLTYFIPLQRIAWLVLPIMLFLYLKNFVYNSFFLIALLCSFIISQIAYIYGYREVFMSTPFYYLLLPSFVSLFHTYPLNFDLNV